MTTPKMTWEEAVKWYIAQPDNHALARAAYLDDPVAAARRYAESAEFAEIKTYLPSTPGRALDLGAGNGILSYALSQAGWDVTAIEPDPSDFIGAGAIRKMATETGADIEVIEAFGEDLPLETANYDVVMARQVLHHANDLGAFCKEMSRLSQNGATIITLRDHVISGPEQMEAFLEGHELHHLYGGEHAYTTNAYRSALEEAGLDVQHELNSFESVINYDPRSAVDIRREISKRFGPLRSIVSLGLRFLPFGLLAKALSKLDRRPGRHVSFVCRKAA